MSKIAVVADVGGTNTRVAWASSETGRIALHDVEVFDTPADLSQPLGEYLGRVLKAKPMAIAAAVAGPIDGAGIDAHAKLTNHDLIIAAAGLAKAAGVDAASLHNDLEAVAYGLASLEASDLAAIGPVPKEVAAAGSRVVIGVGTGVGVAAQLPSGAALATEGGHLEAPFRGEVADARRAQGARSVEDFLSGPHLGALGAAVGHTGKTLDAAELVKRARNGEPIAVETLKWHSAALGQFARDCVLMLGAWQGVYFTGGVIGSIGEALPADVFKSGFVDGRFKDRLAVVPAYRITHPYPGLYGLAVKLLKN